MGTSGTVADVVWAVVSVASLAAVVVGLRLAVGALPTLRDLFRSATTDPQPAGEVSPGGYVEATGLVDTAAIGEIAAPFSGRDCVAYAYPSSGGSERASGRRCSAWPSPGAACF